MKPQTRQTIICLILKISIIAVLLMATTHKLPYDFFIFLRWFVLTASLFLSYFSYKDKQYGFIVLFLTIAILFNPFAKFVFHKSAWHQIDIIIAIVMMLTVITDLIIFLKRKKINRTT
jgi:hypothetical protein